MWEQRERIRFEKLSARFSQLLKELHELEVD